MPPPLVEQIRWLHIVFFKKKGLKQEEIPNNIHTHNTLED